MEHVKIDDLEQFAEEISHGVLGPEDQVLISEAINEALKLIEELRQQCKTRINRFVNLLIILKSYTLNFSTELVNNFSHNEI